MIMYQPKHQNDVLLRILPFCEYSPSFHILVYCRHTVVRIRWASHKMLAQTIGVVTCVTLEIWKHKFYE